MERAGLYRDYPRLLLDVGAAGGDLIVPRFGEAFLRLLDRQNAVAALRFFLPDTWVRSESRRLNRQFWDYYNFKRSDLDLTLDLAPIQQRLAGGAGRDWIAAQMQTWPECSAEDTLAIGARLLTGQQDRMPLCKPPEVLQGAFLGALQAGFNMLAKALPQRVALLAAQAGPPDAGYASLRYGLRFAPAAWLMACLAAVVLLGGSWRRFGTWVSLPFYAGGLITAVSALLFYALAGWALPLPGQLLPASAAELYAFFREVVFLSVERTLAWMAVGGLLCAALGLGLRLAGRNQVSGEEQQY